MKKTLLESKHAPAALGPYSQAVRTDGFVFLSGQIGINPLTGKMVPGGVREQTEQIFKNMNEILKEAGLTLENLVKVTVFLKNMDDFAAVNEIYASNFSKPFPARSAFAVVKLPMDADIEIESIAVI